MGHLRWWGGPGPTRDRPRLYSIRLALSRARPNEELPPCHRPHVAERARQQVAAAGLADRCQVAGGSFFDEVPPGADAYLLENVLVDWNDQRAAAILKKCRAAMPSHGQVLIVEEAYPPCIGQSAEARRAAANDVLMLVCTGGRQRTEVEFRDLLAASGFRLTRVVPTAARVCVIQGERV